MNKNFDNAEVAQEKLRLDTELDAEIKALRMPKDVHIAIQWNGRTLVVEYQFEDGTNASKTFSTLLLNSQLHFEDGSVKEVAKSIVALSAT